MEMSFWLSEEIIQQLRQLPNPDQFVGDVLKNALKDVAARRGGATSQPSEWAKLVQRIDAQPGGLNGYAAQLQRDMQEFRENFAFGQEVEHDVSP